jgi:hypothetical protein
MKVRFSNLKNTEHFDIEGKTHREIGEKAQKELNKREWKRVYYETIKGDEKC